MKRTMMVTAAILTIGCGGGGTGSGSGSDGADGVDGSTGVGVPADTLTRQHAIDQSEWNQVVAGNTDLASLADGLTFVAAGETADEVGNVVTWAVLGDGSGERVVAQGCDPDGACRAATITVEGGKAVFTGPDGSAVEPLLIAAPIMLKELEGTDHEGPTTLPAALTAADVPDVDLLRRRFTLANAYGDVFGVTYSGVAELARTSGAFTEVVDAQYVDHETVAEAIGTASPMDVLVWVGAAVRETVGNQHKTIGMTVNRGIYGDQTFRARTVRELLEAAPYGGPGLVVLVAEQSRGDGSAQETEPLSLVNELADPGTPQIVVGFTGRGQPADLLDSASAFISAFFGGATLAAAVDAANALLEERGSTAALVSNKASTAEEITFTGSLDGFWEGAAPTMVRSNHYLNISNICIPEQGEAYSEPEGFAGFYVDVDFDGPFFTGTRMWESNDVPLSVTVEGVISGTDLGDHVWVTFSGDLKPSVLGLTVWGSGTFVEPLGVAMPEPGRHYYDGTALATDYTNDQGDTCTLKSPTLTGSTAAQKSWLQLPTP